MGFTIDCPQQAGMGTATEVKQVQLPQERVVCDNCGYRMPVEHRYCGLCGEDYLEKP